MNTGIRSAWITRIIWTFAGWVSPESCIRGEPYVILLIQYDPTAEPLKAGGTLNPYTRKVLQTDIDQLRLHKLGWNNDGLAIVGDFSSIYHEKQFPPE